MKILKRGFILVALICVSLTCGVLAGCGSDVKSLAVDTGNAEVVFEVGSEFNAENIVVYAKKSDGKNVRIPKDEYTVTAPDTSTAGEKTVTVTYGDLTATYNVSVVIREVKATFVGEITAGLGAGNTMTYTADFLCYNTLKWELCYNDAHPAIPGSGSYGVKDSGRYKLADGVYTMVLTTSTEQTVTDDAGAVSFAYTGVGLPIAGGRLTGTFHGTLTLKTD